ncbi:chloramphenicol phosphotransferase CPT family protein [Occultella glacieicola]|nr:chloramphenicol phosphotransferase [Occultella glacieicola]
MSTVVILNGVPRSGKSSIVEAIQDTYERPWLNLGVDIFQAATPARHRPGIGLRPGGERPDLEPFVVVAYRAMFAAIAEHLRQGLDVVADVGLHDDYSVPLGIQREAASILQGLDVLYVGVRCPDEVVRQRRRDTWGGTGVTGGALRTGGTRADGADRASGADGDHSVAEGRRGPALADNDRADDPVTRWDRAVHSPGRYDLEVDTSRLTPQQCAERIAARLRALVAAAVPLPDPASPRFGAPPSAFFDVA